MGGVGLGLARTSKQYFRVIKGVSKEWKKINKQSLEKAIFNLYKSKLIHEHENLDGSLTMVLTEKGKQKAITFNIDNMQIKNLRSGIKNGRWSYLIYQRSIKKLGKL